MTIDYTQRFSHVATSRAPAAGNLSKDRGPIVSDREVLTRFLKRVTPRCRSRNRPHGKFSFTEADRWHVSSGGD
jgi:hypothetical protein